MIRLLLALLLNTPPVPPPPPEQAAAATEVLRLAPVPPAIWKQYRDGAISAVAWSAFAGPGADLARIDPVRERLTARVDGSERYAAAVQQCVVNAIGWTYDLPTLQSIARIVTTPGGQALWANAVAEPEQRCQRETLFTFMDGTGLASAVQWLARTRPKGPLPDYDPTHDSLDRLSQRLIAFCGPATRGALAVREGQLRVPAAWADKRRNGPAFSCLLHSASLAGAELTETLADGGTATIIGAPRSSARPYFRALRAA